MLNKMMKIMKEQVACKYKIIVKTSIVFATEMELENQVLIQYGVSSIPRSTPKCWLLIGCYL